MNITLDFVTTPVISVLDRKFVQSATGSNSTSMITLTEDIFAVKCATSEIARNLTRCRVMDTCTCTSNDVFNNCRCANVNITERLLSVDSRLPLHNSEFDMESSEEGVEIDSHSSIAEISLSTSVKWKTATVVFPVDCDVTASKPRGCYNCMQGAKMNFTCTSKARTLTEIACTDSHYTVECGPKGIVSTVIINSKKSRYVTQCTAQCGEKKHTLEISGVLHYHSLWKDTRDNNQEETASYVDLINLPDLTNIAEVFGHWWRTSLLGAAAVAVGVAVTVLCAPFILQRILWLCTTKGK